jgi:hypothetical protein
MHDTANERIKLQLYRTMAGQSNHLDDFRFLNINHITLRDYLAISDYLDDFRFLNINPFPYWWQNVYLVLNINHYMISDLTFLNIKHITFRCFT